MLSKFGKFRLWKCFVFILGLFYSIYTTQSKCIFFLQAATPKLLTFLVILCNGILSTGVSFSNHIFFFLYINYLVIVSETKISGNVAAAKSGSLNTKKNNLNETQAPHIFFVIFLVMLGNYEPTCIFTIHVVTM